MSWLGGLDVRAARTAARPPWPPGPALAAAAVARIARAAGCVRPSDMHVCLRPAGPPGRHGSAHTQGLRGHGRGRRLLPYAAPPHAGPLRLGDAVGRRRHGVAGRGLRDGHPTEPRHAAAGKRGAEPNGQRSCHSSSESRKPLLDASASFQDGVVDTAPVAPPRRVRHCGSLDAGLPPGLTSLLLPAISIDEPAEAEPLLMGGTLPPATELEDVSVDVPSSTDLSLETPITSLLSVSSSTPLHMARYLKSPISADALLCHHSCLASWSRATSTATPADR